MSHSVQCVSSQTNNLTNLIITGSHSVSRSRKQWIFSNSVALNVGNVISYMISVSRLSHYDFPLTFFSLEAWLNDNALLSIYELFNNQPKL